MLERGITFHEIEVTLREGWDAASAKPGTFGRAMVFRFEAEWEGRFYEEKEVTVFYKFARGGEFMLLTAIAKYGKNFDRLKG